MIITCSVLTVSSRYRCTPRVSSFFDQWQLGFLLESSELKPNRKTDYSSSDESKEELDKQWQCVRLLDVIDASILILTFTAFMSPGYALFTSMLIAHHLFAVDCITKDYNFSPALGDGVAAFVEADG